MGGLAIASRPGLRFNIAMPELTHRRYPERHDCWHVFYGDVHVGTIAARVGAASSIERPAAIAALR
jgi:hypothetical protein